MIRQYITPKGKAIYIRKDDIIVRQNNGDYKTYNKNNLSRYTLQRLETLTQNVSYYTDVYVFYEGSTIRISRK